ncbi:MAG: isocitrate/isopropylmalate dehydrogenase family protein, partial [Euryarchaeota archaeon]|nr:isocitrate/isopropylmalate dehydrogenase family protein [Euryarchaeota archaeon]
KFDLYANVRPVKRLCSDLGLVDLDLIIIRENTEGMYTGVEHDVVGGVITERLVTENACRRLIDYAVELCHRQGRKKLTCVHKSNVLRRSDGLFRRIFQERTEGARLEREDMLVDAAAAALITKPKDLDVIVTLNLYGDILSDEASALVGGLGFTPTVNMGDKLAIFEPTHGSAPDIAGKGIANPTATILSAAMMLRHLGMNEKASMLEVSIEKTLEQGHRTRDAGGQLRTDSFMDKYLEILETL